MENYIVNKSYSIDESLLPFTDCVRDLGVYHDCRLKYDREHISIIVHHAYKRAVLNLNSFHSRDPQILKRAYCVYVRPLLEFSSQIWFPRYKYLIDQTESVQRYFTKRLFGLSKLYCERLTSLDLDTLLQRRRVIYDLDFVIRCYIDYAMYLSLLIMHAERNTRGNYLELNKQFCFTELEVLFSSEVIDAWNSLYNDVVKSSYVCIFRK